MSSAGFISFEKKLIIKEPCAGSGKFVFSPHKAVIICCSPFFYKCMGERTVYRKAHRYGSRHKKGDDYYLAGDFNKWNPGDYNFKLKPFGAVKAHLRLKIYPPAKLAFKFTRGSWDRVESTAKGEDLENHEVEITGDTTFSYAIAGWKMIIPTSQNPIQQRPG